MNKKLILNHKSYLNINEIEVYKKELEKVSSKNIDIILFPSVIYLSMFNDYKHKVGAQNFYSYNYGNYTGEINLESLKNLGINYTLLNHYERIENGIDSYNIVKEKVFKSLSSNFNTILMVGETKKLKNPFSYIKKQLNYYLKNIEEVKIKNLSILYEPSWILDSSEYQDINVIRKIVVQIKEYFIKKYKLDIEVYYASGVTKENINEILEVCDGVGLGKKSTDVKYIKDIIDKLSQNMTK